MASIGAAVTAIASPLTVNVSPQGETSDESRSAREERPVIHLNDQKTLRINNQLAILNALRDHGPLSRKSLQRETGLSWGTITYLTGELISQDIVRETGMVATQVGRRPVNLDLNTGTNYAIGIRMGNVRVDASLLDLKGNSILERTLPLDPSETAGEIVNRIFDAVDTITTDASVSLQQVAGIGCAVPGSYNPRTGICAYAPNHPRWRNVPLLSRLADRFGRPAFVDHDMNCAVLGEYLFGAARRFSSFVCINIEGGIGAGVMIDGRIYRGADNSAGELGHISVYPDGPRCNCGKVGCLEAVASVGALSASARRLRDEPDRTHPPAENGDDGHHEEIDRLITAARLGNRDIRFLLEEAGHYLGVGIGILVTLFNPETVILGGSLCRAKDFIQPAMDASLKDTAWPYSRADVRFSILDDGVVLGAAGMVLQEIFTGALLFRRTTDPEQAAL
jgi:predicted NBD/HSP70 family sugar kinase